MGVSNGSNNYKNVYSSKISRDKNLWTNYIDEYFDVYIKSNRAKGFSYAHHYLLLKGNDDWFRIAEWASPNNDGDPCHIFSCKKIECYDCRYLGKYKLRSILNGIKCANNSGDNDYNRFTYNCNHWVENVASYLGRKIEVSRNCNCIDGNISIEEIVSRPQRTKTILLYQPQQSIIQQPMIYNRQFSFNQQPIYYYNPNNRMIYYNYPNGLPYYKPY
jgi:hypothetical protein